MLDDILEGFVLCFLTIFLVGFETGVSKRSGEGFFFFFFSFPWHGYSGLIKTNWFCFLFFGFCFLFLILFIIDGRWKLVADFRPNR